MVQSQEAGFSTKQIIKYASRKNIKTTLKKTGLDPVMQHQIMALKDGADLKRSSVGWEKQMDRKLVKDKN
jgi:hypothetical protein